MSSAIISYTKVSGNGRDWPYAPAAPHAFLAFHLSVHELARNPFASTKTQARLDVLMGKNNEGTITAAERKGLTSLGDKIERLSLENAKLLGRHTQSQTRAAAPGAKLPVKLMKTTPHVDEFVHGRVLEVNLHGKLARRDFDQIVPETERLIRRFEKIRILVTLRDFDGWDLGAMWEEIKWEAKHFNHVEKIAIVGDSKWHRRMVGLCNAVTTAEVRYFNLDDFDAACQWVDS